MLFGSQKHWEAALNVAPCGTQSSSFDHVSLNFCPIIGTQMLQEDVERVVIKQLIDVHAMFGVDVLSTA